jgi:hypothetical protein
MAKSKRATTTSSWNEFNTFSKLIYPELQIKLKYPERSSKYFDEQTWVRKRGEKNGPYDGAFKNETGVILLIEAKKEEHRLLKKDEEQLFDYCLGGFPIPPPYALLSNGVEYKWFKRLKNKEDEFSYAPCDPIPWKKAVEEKGAGLLTEQLTLKQTIRLLKSVRGIVFDDLTDQFFPNGYKFISAKLGTHKKGFDKILYTRKSFVDPTLEDADDDVVIKSILSSIALSITLKVLFVKIITDRKNDPFPEKFKKEISKLAKNFPGILKAEPYDALDISDSCEELIAGVMASASITQALVFEGRSNPIGDIWDGLVESEELDLQVKSLGNVYTPPEIVNAMVDRAEETLGTWKDKRVLEPSCGSGHFVREVYERMRDTYLGNSGTPDKVIQAHKNTMANLRALDIDPFAVQTTQLGMFLELYSTPAIWNTIAPQGKFDFGQVVHVADFLDNGLFSRIENFKSDLIIGNPPYGIKVTKELVDQFKIGNNDSYGCFVSKSLELLNKGGRLLFILSSTFLTARTHSKLREQIFRDTYIDSLLTLHRNIFPGRDVFCVILDLKKRIPADSIEDHFYRFYDAWPIHPNSEHYQQVLKDWSFKKDTKIDESLFGDYHFPQNLMTLRLMPPSPSVVESEIKKGKKSVGLNLLNKSDVVYPIVSGKSSLYLLCADKEYDKIITYSKMQFPKIGEVQCINIKRDKNIVPTIKLWQVAQVRQGLATADDNLFLRKTPGVIANARRRDMKDVDLNCVVNIDKQDELSEDEKNNGIKVIDKKKDRYFVPLDKGGESDPHGGELRSFWSPVDYWIDWSRSSVNTLKERDKWKPGTPKKPRFQNRNHYFKQGIRFARAGLYSPTFELGFGGVFSDKGSLIIPFSEEITKYLLGILCSPLTRYLTKSFLQHTVMTEIDIIRQIPIAVPTNDQFKKITGLVDIVLIEKKKGKYAEKEMNDCWKEIYSLYGIGANDQGEIETWFKRRYPHFGKSKDA